MTDRELLEFEQEYARIIEAGRRAEANMTPEQIAMVRGAADSTNLALFGKIAKPAFLTDEQWEEQKAMHPGFESLFD